MKDLFAKIKNSCSSKAEKLGSKVGSIFSNTHSAEISLSLQEAETFVETKPYESLRYRTPASHISLTDTSQGASKARANDDSDTSALTLAAELLPSLTPAESKGSPEYSASEYTMNAYSQDMLIMQQSTNDVVTAPDNGTLADLASAEQARPALRRKASKTNLRNQGLWPVPRASAVDTTSNAVNQAEDVLLAQAVYDCEDLDLNGNPFLTLVTLKTANDQAQGSSGAPEVYAEEDFEVEDNVFINMVTLKTSEQQATSSGSGSQHQQDGQYHTNSSTDRSTKDQNMSTMSPTMMREPEANISISVSMEEHQQDIKVQATAGNPSSGIQVPAELLADHNTSDSVTDNRDFFLALKDGREMCFREYGDPHGHNTLIFLHPFGAGRFGGQELDEHATALGIRLICPDRPGVGRSSPWSERDQYAIRHGHSIVYMYLLDLAALICHLGLGEYGILAMSLGTPYALGASLWLDKLVNQAKSAVVETVHQPGRIRVSPPVPRLTAIGIISAMVPKSYGTTGMPLSVRGIWNASHYLPCTKRILKRIVARAIRRGITETRLEAATRPAFRSLHGNLDDLWSQGPEGALLELDALTQPGKLAWGFSTDSLRWKAADGYGIRFFHGSKDELYPWSNAAKMADTIRGSQFRTFSGAMHTCIIFEDAAQVLREVIQAMRPDPAFIRRRCGV